MREALKLAVEALNEWRVEWSPAFYEEEYDSDEPEENTRRTLVKSAITAIKEALAQSEQEPVAWIYKSEPSFYGNKWHDTFEVTTSKQVALWKDKAAKPLYTTPPQRTWVGLTDKEAHELWESTDSDDDWELMKRTEAKLKEKNT